MLLAGSLVRNPPFRFEPTEVSNPQLPKQKAAISRYPVSVGDVSSQVSFYID